MAIQTKTFIGSTGNYLWTWKIEVIEEEGSILNRTSPVTINAYIGRASSQSYFAGKATLTYRAGNQTYSEEYKNYNSITINGGAWYKIGTHTFTVENKGTTQNPTILDCRCDMSNATFSPGNATANGSIQLKVLHQAPDISFTLAETKLSGVAANQWVLGLSGKRFTITATPYDGKRVTLYSVMQDNTQVGYSTTNQVNIDISKIVIKEGKINLRVQATDETGTTGYKDVEYTNYIEYFKPSLIATSSMVKRNGQTSGKAKLYLTGIFYNDTIGTVTNTVSLKFSYWIKDTTPVTTEYSIPSNAITILNNNISINGWEMMKGTSLLTDLVKENAYTFKIIATDAFGQSSEPIELSCSKGIWLMAKFKDRVDFQKITINNENVYGGREVAHLSTPNSRTYTNATWSGPAIIFDNLTVTNQNYFQKNGNKLKVLKAGTYLILFSCLMNTGTTEMDVVLWCPSYVRKNNYCNAPSVMQLCTLKENEEVYVTLNNGTNNFILYNADLIIIKLI